jgi:hypothetical protein
MCVLLCANSTTRQWAEAIAMVCERDMLQEIHACKCGDVNSANCRAVDVGCGTLDEQAVEKIPRGPMLRDDWPRATSLMMRRRRTHSAVTSNAVDPCLLHERKSPFDALADAWSRLLVLIGWSR